MASDELAIVVKLRKALAAQGSQAGIEQLLDQLRKTNSNAELLMNVGRSIIAGDGR